MQIEATLNGVTFTWGLAGPDGAWFILYPDPTHTKEDVKTAKREIRNQRDAVSIRVATEDDRYDLFRSIVFSDPRTRDLHWTQMEFEKEDWKRQKLSAEAFVTKHLPEWNQRPKLTSEEFKEQYLQQ